MPQCFSIHPPPPTSQTPQVSLASALGVHAQVRITKILTYRLKNVQLAQIHVHPPSLTLIKKYKKGLVTFMYGVSPVKMVTEY